MSDASGKIGAAVLFRNRPRVNFKAFCDGLNQAFPELENSLELVAHRRNIAVFSQENLHIVVAINKKPYPRDEISVALTSPIARAKIFKFEAKFKAHRSHIYIAVNDFAWSPELAALTSTDIPSISVAQRARILREAVLLLERYKPTMVYWRQSEMLFDPSELHIGPTDTLPMAQMVHPLPVQDPEMPDNQGVICTYSENILGKTLQIDPAARPVLSSLNIALSVMIEAKSGGLQLRQGEVVETKSGEVLYVYHQPPCLSWQAGRICLTDDPEQVGVLPEQDHFPTLQLRPSSTRAMRHFPEQKKRVIPRRVKGAVLTISIGAVIWAFDITKMDAVDTALHFVRADEPLQVPSPV